jgi:hypothetical protein
LTLALPTRQPEARSGTRRRSSAWRRDPWAGHQIVIEYGLISGATSAVQNGVLQALESSQRLGMVVVNLAIDHPLLFLVGLAAFLGWAVVRVRR